MHDVIRHRRLIDDMVNASTLTVAMSYQRHSTKKRFFGWSSRGAVALVLFGVSSFAGIRGGCSPNLLALQYLTGLLHDC